MRLKQEKFFLNTHRKDFNKQRLGLKNKSYKATSRKHKKAFLVKMKGKENKASK